MICETEDNEIIEFDDSDTCEPSIDNLRLIVQKHSAKLFVWKGSQILVDVQTANVMVQVYDLIKPENQEKVARMIKASGEQFHKVVTIAWKAAS